jgi:hypothetical protein
MGTVREDAGAPRPARNDAPHEGSAMPHAAHAPREYATRENPDTASSPARGPQTPLCSTPAPGRGRDNRHDCAFAVWHEFCAVASALAGAAPLSSAACIAVDR